MKNLIIILTLFFICSCAGQQTVKKVESLPSPPVSTIPVQTLQKPQSLSVEPVAPLFGEVLSDVRTSTFSFNPSHGDEVAIFYRLSGPAKVNINIYDPDCGLIRAIATKEYIAPGEHTTIWDGKDMDGNVVPDEAYFFTIISEDKSGHKEIYDPTMFSGGIEYDISSADVNLQSGTVTYKMPEMGRVMIRMGVQGGPLLNTLVDWKPRVKGVITEYWNGRDKDNLIDLYNNPKFKIIITYFTLPQNSIITFANKSITYRSYKNDLAKEMPIKKDRPGRVQSVSPHYRIPRTADYSPDVKMTFKNTKGTDEEGIPVLTGKTLVKVELDEQDRLFFQNQQFEICFFLDNEFYAEDEAGYTPFNWVWNLSNVSEGEHLLTVNLSGFKDQIGVLTRKVRVVK